MILHLSAQLFEIPENFRHKTSDKIILCVFEFKSMVSASSMSYELQDLIFHE